MSWKKMKKAIQETKDARQKEQMLIQMSQPVTTNPKIQAIEDVFTPETEVGKQERQKDGEELRDGVFIKRNQNIAPYYKQYKQEKCHVLRVVQKRKEANAKSKMEQIIEQKKIYN